MFLMSQISGISIAGFVILALFVLLGLKKGFLRMLLTVLAIGLSIAAGSLAVKPIYNALAKKDFFGQEWLEGALSGNFAFLIVGLVTLVILLIIKAIIMHFVNKKGGKIKGALNVVNHIAGALVGAGIGFLAFGFILICYVTIYAFIKHMEVEQVIAGLDSVSSWMMENNVFQKIVDALTNIKESISGTEAFALQTVSSLAL